jgi:abhydrolase domain-containing protein 2
MLTERYTPPLLWGMFGQAQTFLYGVVGRFGLKRCIAKERVFLRLPDESTMTYDVFEPEAFRGVTVVCCPGIGNTSECSYLHSMIAHANRHGYRVAVLNHTGGLEGVPITSQRIFTYGGTGELAAMFEDLKGKYPVSQFAVVGMSLGANLVIRFLGERPERQREFLCAVSICQGYDPLRAMPFFCDWDKLRILYNWHITKKMKQAVYRHGNTLLDNCRKLRPLEGDIYYSHGDRDCSGLSHSKSEPVDIEGLKKARLIKEFDEAFTR